MGRGRPRKEPITRIRCYKSVSEVITSNAASLDMDIADYLKKILDKVL